MLRIMKTDSRSLLYNMTSNVVARLLNLSLCFYMNITPPVYLSTTIWKIIPSIFRYWKILLNKCSCSKFSWNLINYSYMLYISHHLCTSYRLERIFFMIYFKISNTTWKIYGYANTSHVSLKNGSMWCINMSCGLYA